jgi:putative DNA primase/helicase
MATKHDQMIVGWSQGTGANLASSKNKSQSWGSLKKMLWTPHATPERRKEFDKASKDEQDKLKATAGWFSGAQMKGNHRALKNVMPRDLLTLDLDYIPDYVPELITDGFTKISHLEAFYHSSRRHTRENPRVRIIAPVSRPLDPDEYQALARGVAYMLDAEMQWVDLVSFRPAQMMFRPTCSADDVPNFFRHEQEGQILDPDVIFAWMDEKFGDHRDPMNWPRHPDERDFRKRAERAEDPTTKSGPVGTFCRAFDIESAMAEFIPGVYLPGDEHSGMPRYTYFNSTSSNGAVVYDGGLFLYSHHGHDPLNDMNVNAFDMVRIHLFGDHDAKTPEGTSPSKMPSYKAMLLRAREHDGFRKQLIEDKLGDTRGGFDDIEEQETDSDDRHPDNRSSVEDDEEDVLGTFHFPDRDVEGGGGSNTSGERASSHEDPRERFRPKHSIERKPADDWLTEDLEVNDTGEVIPHLANVSLIAQSDDRFVGVIRLNTFTNQIVFKKDLRPAIATASMLKCHDTRNGERWEDNHDHIVRSILETENGRGKRGYGFKVSERDLQAGLSRAAEENSFHPIIDYLSEIRWDGVKRLDTMLIRYLGTPDTPYHREVSWLMLTASVTRIMHPGHKFDFACIIKGPQGVGKSTFIQTLYSEDWFGEIRCDLSDKQKIAEEIAGIWGGELPELAALGKSDHNAAKAFMRATKDDVRMVYDRRVKEFPRQAVFWGTTNDDIPLRDPTGNRSWWMTEATVPKIDLTALAAERDQLWAEAVERYMDMRAAKPHGTLPLFLSDEARVEAEIHQEAARSEEIFEDWTDRILDWLDTPLSLHAFKLEIGAKVEQDFSDDDAESKIMVLRCVFIADMAADKVLFKKGGVVNDQASRGNINKMLKMLDRAGWTGAPDVAAPGKITARRVQGILKRWRRRPGATPEEVHCGYRIIENDDDEDLDNLV